VTSVALLSIRERPDFKCSSLSGYEIAVFLYYSGDSAREAPWVRKIVNPSSRENLVMTSAYERESERANVRTDSGGGGGACRDSPHCHPYGKLRNAISP